jgi:hypothetical protein
LPPKWTFGKPEEIFQIFKQDFEHVGTHNYIILSSGLKFGTQKGKPHPRI